MKVELKVAEVKKHIGKSVYVEWVDVPFMGKQFVNLEITDVQGKNIEFNHSFDWIHFSKIKALHTEKPCT